MEISKILSQFKTYNQVGSYIVSNAILELLYDKLLLQKNNNELRNVKWVCFKTKNKADEDNFNIRHHIHFVCHDNKIFVETNDGRSEYLVRNPNDEDLFNVLFLILLKGKQEK